MFIATQSFEPWRLSSGIKHWYWEIDFDRQSQCFPNQNGISSRPWLSLDPAWASPCVGSLWRSQASCWGRPFLLEQEPALQEALRRPCFVEHSGYDSMSDLGEIRVYQRADFQSGSRVLKKVFWTLSYLYLWHTMWFHAKKLLKTLNR